MGCVIHKAKGNKDKLSAVSYRNMLSMGMYGPTLPLIWTIATPMAIYDVISTGFLPNRGAAAGSNTRYASSFRRSFRRNHSSA